MAFECTTLKDADSKEFSAGHMASTNKKLSNAKFDRKLVAVILY